MFTDQQQHSVCYVSVCVCHVSVCVCQFAEQQPCVFVLDEAHYVDCASWSVLLQLQLQAHVLLFLSTLPSSTAQPSSTLASLAGLPRSRCLRLAPLEPLVITQLACQMLGVDLIPSQVEVYVHTHTPAANTHLQ